MITGYILGAITMLVGSITGYIMGKTWLDKRFNRIAQKSKNNQTGTTP